MVTRSAVWLAGATATLVGVASQPGAQTADPPTYHKDIAPIIQRSCLGCHSPGGSAPFALENYAQVVNNIELVRIQTLARSMPPMFARSDYGSFSHRTPLTDEELITLQRWYQAKLPQGEPRPPVAADAEVRALADCKLQSGTATVRAEGARYWMVYALDLPAGCDRIDGFTFVPKSPKAVRQATVAVVPASFAPKEPVAETFGSMDVRGEYLVGAWAPGYNDWRLGNGYAKTLPPGGKVLVQVLYQPTGKTEDAGFVLGFHKAENTDKLVSSVTLEKDTFLIEALQSKTFSFDYRLKSAASIHSVIPEARFFAASIRLTAKTPDGKLSTLFETFRWDPYWTGNYQVPTAPVFPAGTWLHVDMEYNNDERCTINADKAPTAVRSGKGLEDEVCRFHLVLQPAQN